MTNQLYEYNVFDAHEYATHIPGTIAVYRYNVIFFEDDGFRQTDTYGEHRVAYVYAPESGHPETGIDYVEDMWFDSDDAALPWFVPLLDFDTEKETTR